MCSSQGPWSQPGRRSWSWVWMEPVRPACWAAGPPAARRQMWSRRRASTPSPSTGTTCTSTSWRVSLRLDGNQPVLILRCLTQRLFAALSLRLSCLPLFWGANGRSAQHRQTVPNILTNLCCRSLTCQLKLHFNKQIFPQRNYCWPLQFFWEDKKQNKHLVMLHIGQGKKKQLAINFRWIES